MPRQERSGKQRGPKQTGMDTDTVVVACQQNQRNQNRQGPHPLTGQCYSHGVTKRIKYSVGGGFHLHTKELVPCKMKRKKGLTLFTAQEFQHSKSGSNFQRCQIWNNHWQKPKKNYGRHPLILRVFCVRRVYKGSIFLSLVQADRAFGTDYCMRFSFVILLS